MVKKVVLAKLDITTGSSKVRFVAEKFSYNRTVPSGSHNRVGWQVTASDDDSGEKRAVFVIGTRGNKRIHYHRFQSFYSDLKYGINASDKIIFDKQRDFAKFIAEQLNKKELERWTS